MPDAYSPASAADLAPLLIEDDQGRALVDAPADLLAGDEPGAYLLRAFAYPDLLWPTHEVSLRLVPGSESDVALRRRLRQIEEARP